MSLIIRPFRDGDQDSLVENANNKAIFDNVKDTFPYPYTLPDANWWVSENSPKSPDEISKVMAIEVDGKAIGAIGIILGTDVQRINAEIGYWLGENYWGKGIATESLIWMTNYTFEKFPSIHRIWAGVFGYNKSSMRVLEKAGFTFEATHYQSVIKNDIIGDECIFVKLR
jgi:[ribosomal protein S5]-alanine N-acetyltransferase